MDRIAGFNVNFFHPADILSYIRQQPDVLKHKKAIELFTGFLWANCLMHVENVPFRVCFPLKRVEKHARPGAPLLALGEDSGSLRCPNPCVGRRFRNRVRP